jgi:hypothetical protein
MLRSKLAAVATAAVISASLTTAPAHAAPFMDYTDDACTGQIIAILIGLTAPLGSTKGS